MSYRLTGTLAMVAALALGGCAQETLATRLASDDPRVRVSGVYDAQQVPGAETDVRLIHLLVDEDVSVRMFASTALAKRTGQRFGYLPAATLAERAAAVRQWVQWCESKYPDLSGRLDDLREWLKNLQGDAPASDQPKVDEPKVDEPKQQVG